MNLKNKDYIPLDKFIENALYNKSKGYYMRKNPFGAKGDFITSPSISILFSEMISIWLVSLWESLKKPKKINIVELGPGNGDMLYQIIKSSENFPNFKSSCKFFMYEKSPYLKKIQKQKLRLNKIKWLKKINQIKNGPTIFLCNEFFDALPIKQIIKKKNEWYEKYVKINEEKKFIYKKFNIKKLEKKIGIKISNKQNFIEFSPNAYKILYEISKIINRQNGGVLIIDYGNFKEKMFDTIKCYKNHKIVNILDDNDMDITYKINFRLIEKIIKKFKLQVKGTSNQKNFLTKLGIIERAEIISKNLTFSKKVDIYTRLKRLIDVNQMGSLFKVVFISNRKLNFRIGF
tara:strand:+ start:3474 stop:4511 length:1038 start_codon:yes stop_codon:yes gene_type:complete